jgi:PAS domain S-box-containing protein
MNASRSLHESLVELLPDAVLALDVEGGRFVLANTAAERLLGTTRAELVRLSLRDLVRPWDIGLLERAEAAMRADGSWRGELWLRRHDGMFVPTEVAAQAWTLDGRTLVQYCCRDASSRWRDDAMRRVISHAAERLTATFDDREVLRTVVMVALPGLADAALVELDAVDGAEAVAVAAFADPATAVWSGVAVDEAPAPETRDAIRRGSTLAVPLVVEGRRLGLLTLRRASNRLWEIGDQPLIEELARHAAHAIDQSRQWAGARRELDHRAAIIRILSTIDADDSPHQVHKVLLEEALRTIQAEDAGIARWDADRGVLIQALSPAGRFNGAVLDQRRSMAGLAAAERRALIENDYQRSVGKQTPAGRAGARAVLAVPMIHRGVLLGSMSVSQLRSARRFQQDDARRLELLASAAAMTLAGMARQRTAGARLATREAAHLLNNDLTVTMGSLDMLRQADDLPPALGPLVDTALNSLSQAADHLAQLQQLRRVETRDGPLGPRLDLARSTGQDAAV